MNKFSVVDEFRCLAAQCEVQADADASGVENQLFIFHLFTCLERVEGADAFNMRVILLEASSGMLDDELPQLLRDAAGALRFAARANPASLAVAA